MAITKEEILAKCSQELIDSRDCHAIAATVSEGRTRASKTEIGNGSIITALQDLETANRLLDVLHTDARFKYVVPLLDQGRLLIGDAMVAQVISGFVPAILTQAQADRLLALGKEPNPVSAVEIAEVLYNDEGVA